MRSISILVINPNSSQSITDGLASSLVPSVAGLPNVELDFYTGPAHVAAAIVDYSTMASTSVHCYEDLLKSGKLDKYDGYLCCCFSDLPLQHMIREYHGTGSKRLCVGMFEAAISECMLYSRRFGALCVGTGQKPLLPKGVSAYLGANGSDRWMGYVASGLGVLELREGDRNIVEMTVRDAARKVAELGAEAIMLGCAGFSGMEDIVLSGASEAVGGRTVRVVDGSKAGLKMLIGALLVT